jgi:hypothetical protein
MHFFQNAKNYLKNKGFKGGSAGRGQFGNVNRPADNQASWIAN